MRRNLISGNVNAVMIEGSLSQHNQVQSNYVGTDVTGTSVIGNVAGIGLLKGASLNAVGVDGDGANDALEGNLVSGNAQGGILIYWGASDNKVAGNLVGTDKTGLIALPSPGGVSVSFQGSRNLIGTDADGVSDELERNVIVAGVGVVLDPLVPSVMEDNVIAGNYIGVDITGENAFGVGANWDQSRFHESRRFTGYTWPPAHGDRR